MMTAAKRAGTLPAQITRTVTNPAAAPRVPRARTAFRAACDDERRYTLVMRRLPFGEVHDLRAGSVCLDRLNALVGTLPASKLAEFSGYSRTKTGISLVVFV